MRIRDDLLTHQDDMGISGTKVYNLDYADLITSLDLDFGATNGATDNKNNPIERNISKIEIVDGSDVLWSLPGDVAYALFAQEHGAPADDYYTGQGGDTPYVTIPIRFGRHLYDPELAFNPTKFKNPQLRITFDEATVRAAGATGFVSDSFHVSILARLMENAPAPKGWLMAKDIYNFTSAASGDEVVEMPTDYPYRMIILRAYEAGTDWRGTLTNLKLSCDLGRFAPFDDTSGNINSRMCEMFKPVIRSGHDKADDGDAFQTWIGIDLGQALHAQTASRIVSAGGFWPGQFTVAAKTEAGAAATDCLIRWMVHGWAPHNTVLIPFGRLDQIAEWFQSPGYGSVKLYLTQGDADAEVNVCLQQYRKY